MARRSKGEGSVHRSPDGSGWVATIELPPRPDGRRIRKKRRARTKAEAQGLLRQMREDVERHGGVGDGVRTIADTIADYLVVRGSEDLAPKTLELDCWRAELIIAGLGRQRSASLTVSDCDRFLRAASRGEVTRDRQARPIGRAHLRRVRSMLIAALRNDLRLGLVTRNPAELSVLPAPSTKPSQKRSLTAAELARLVDASSGVLAVMVQLCGRNGLRPAEARSLVWESIDTEQMQIEIRTQMNASNEIVAPKTKRSARVISCDSQTIEVLVSWKADQAELRAVAGVAWCDQANLLVTTAEGKPLSRTSSRRDLIQACKLAGVEPITVYELRHTAITLQCEAGHPAFRIADWAGTSERMIADTYRHRLVEVSPVGPVRLDAEH